MLKRRTKLPWMTKKTLMNTCCSDKSEPLDNNQAWRMRKNGVGGLKCLTFISYFMTNELANSVISLHNFEIKCKIKVAEIFLEETNLNLNLSSIICGQHDYKQPLISWGWPNNDDCLFMCTVHFI